MRSTSGRSIRSRNIRAYVESDSMYRHCPSANRVSNASDDLPEPETPVTTVSRSCGISTEMFLRLFCRAPSMGRAGGCDIRAVLLRWVVYWRCYHGVQMSDPIHVLVVDDDKNVRSLLVAVLSRSPFTVVEAASGGDAMAHLAREEFDVALVDLQLPDHSGLDILRWAGDADVDAGLIVLTGHADVETAVEAMRLGAYDFITKPCKNAELREVVAKAFEKKSLRRENSALKEVITRRDGLPTIVGTSPEIREVLAVITRVAASDSPVLVQGESGTGKELVARTIHLRSKRAGRPFVSINCSALP